MNDLSQEDIYLKSRLVGFYECLGFFYVVMSSKVAPKKQKKWKFEMNFLVEAATCESYGSMCLHI